MGVDIKTIEGAYIREFGVKKINKKTKKWKSFYNDYRKKKEAVSTSKPKSKSKKKSSVRSTSMTFNGKKYGRGKTYYGTKVDAEAAKKRMKKAGKSAILDKRKAGYFFWVRG